MTSVVILITKVEQMKSANVNNSDENILQATVLAED